MTPAVTIRSVGVVDMLTKQGLTIVLTDAEALLVNEVGSLILQAAVEEVPLSTLAAQIKCHEPSGTAREAAVDRAVSELSSRGLLAITAEGDR